MVLILLQIVIGKNKKALFLCNDLIIIILIGKIMLLVTFALCLIAIGCMIKNKIVRNTLFILSILLSVLSMFL